MAHTELVGQHIDNGRLEVLSVLGQGAYGVVYLAREECTAATASRCPCQGGDFAPHGQLVAVKCFSKSNTDARQREFQRREVALHSLASMHHGVATLHRVFEENSHVFLVMDYLAGGDLFTMITDNQRYVGDDELIRTVFLQILDAVEFCHSVGIHHRDLKPENILCSEDGTQVVLADFGLATTQETTSDFGCGSKFYLSPECQGGLTHAVDSYSSVQADLWSLGIILVNLACVLNPWAQASLDDKTFSGYLQDPACLGRNLPLSPAVVDILSGCFAENPKDRISLTQMRKLVASAPRFSTLSPRSIYPLTPVTPFTLRHAPSLSPEFGRTSTSSAEHFMPPTPPLTPLDAWGWGGGRASRPPRPTPPTPPKAPPTPLSSYLEPV